MIYLHKILPVFLSPIFIVLALAVIGVIMRRRSFVVASVCLLYLASTPLVSEMIFKQVEQPQGKLVRVTQGEVFDVCVNLKRGHPQFGHWAGTHLSAANKRQLWIPPGFAHGFLVLSDSTDFMYKTTGYYSPTAERCLLWNDPALSIQWPLAALGELSPILTPKDQAGMPLANASVFDR